MRMRKMAVVGEVWRVGRRSVWRAGKGRRRVVEGIRARVTMVKRAGDDDVHAVTLLLLLLLLLLLQKMTTTTKTGN